MCETIGLGPGAVVGGKYMVTRILGCGGMADVFEANPLTGAGLVAIKRLRLTPEDSDHADEVVRLRSEYEMLAMLSHPALPKAIEFLEEPGAFYLVEEHAAGCTLQEEMDRLGRLDHDRAIRIMLPICDALMYLHERGIIHRDIKPSNIMITPQGGVCLIDLGAARKWKQSAASDTQPLGTPGYASPEHFGGRQTDARSDIYSVAATLHHVLTGVEPDVTSPWTCRNSSQFPSAVPPWIVSSVVRALAADPGDRFESCKAFRYGLLGIPPYADYEAIPWDTPADPIELGDMEQVIAHPDFSHYLSTGWYFVLLGAMAGWLVVNSPSTPTILQVTGVLMGGACGIGGVTDAWREFQSCRVEICSRGVRFVSGADAVHEALWSEVRGIRVTKVLELRGKRSRVRFDATFYLPLGEVHLAGKWPGLTETVEKVASRAGLRSVHEESGWGEILLYTR